MSRRAVFKFRLYVAGDAPNSTQALTNLGVFCQTYLLDQHEIEVVDAFRDPKRALLDNILMTPTLIKLGPAPVRRVVGTLSQTQHLLQALGLSIKVA